MKPMNIRTTKRLFINNKGVTLVEMVVTIAIITIIVGLTSTIILASQNIFRRNANEIFGKQIGENILNFVKEELEYSTTMKISDEQDLTGEYTNALYVEDGRLMYYKDDLGFVDLFGSEFYNSYKVYLDLDAENFSLSRLYLRVLDAEDEIVYETSTTIRFLNYSINPESFLKPVTNQGEIINLSVFKVFYTK